MGSKHKPKANPVKQQQAPRIPARKFENYTLEQYLIVFLLPVLLLYISYTLFGSFFETNDDPRYVLAMKGVATPKPYDNFISVYRFTVDWYIWLYQHFPTVAWYGWSMFLLLWFAVANTGLLLFYFLGGRLSNWIIALMIAAAYLLLFLQSEYYMNFTRPAILATGTSVLLFALLIPDKETLKKRKLMAGFLIIAFILGHLTRIDAGYLAFAFCAVFLVLNSFKGMKIWSVKLLYPLLPFLAVIMLVKVSDSFSIRKGNEDFVEKARLLKEYDNYQNIRPFTPENIRDSLTFDAAVRAYYLTDNSTVTVNFLKKVTGGPLLEQGINYKKLDESLKDFKISILGDSSPALMFTVFFLFCTLLYYWKDKKQGGPLLFRFLFFQVFFAGLLLTLIVFMKLPARIYNPMLLLFVLCNFILFMGSGLYTVLDRFKMITAIAGLAAAIIFIPGYFSGTHKNLKNYSMFGRINNAMVENMNSFKNTIFIPTNISAWEVHFATDPIKEMNMLNGNSYVYLSIELSLAPETQDQLIAKFGTNDHSKLFKKISEMDNVVFISDDNYNNFLGAYYHFLYGQDYKFEPVQPYPAPLYKNNGLNYYRVRKM